MITANFPPNHLMLQLSRPDKVEGQSDLLHSSVDEESVARGVTVERETDPNHDDILFKGTFD